MSSAFAKELAPLLGPGFTLNGAADTAIDCGTAVRVSFQDAKGNLISASRQCLSAPMSVSRVAGPGAQLEVKPDGTALVESSADYLAMFAVASPGGEFTVINAAGPAGGSPPMTVSQLRQLVVSLG